VEKNFLRHGGTNNVSPNKKNVGGLFRGLFSWTLDNDNGILANAAHDGIGDIVII